MRKKGAKMYQELSLTGFKFFNQLTDNYTDMVRCAMGLDRSEQDKLVTKQTSDAVDVAAVSELSDKFAELDELRRQVQMLNQKIERLEKNKKANQWNKSGKGHWRL